MSTKRKVVLGAGLLTATFSIVDDITRYGVKKQEPNRLQLGIRLFGSVLGGTLVVTNLLSKKRTQSMKDIKDEATLNRLINEINEHARQLNQERGFTRQEDNQKTFDILYGNTHERAGTEYPTGDFDLNQTTSVQPPGVDGEDEFIPAKTSQEQEEYRSDLVADIYEDLREEIDSLMKRNRSRFQLLTYIDKELPKKITKARANPYITSEDVELIRSGLKKHVMQLV